MKRVNGLAGSRPPKRRMTLTGQERQILMAELAEIALELDALQERTTEITARVAHRTSIDLAQSA